MPVMDQWFDAARQVEVLGTLARVVAPTELVWSKAFIQLRHRYDGPDIAHVILKRHGGIDWGRLLSCMEAHWEALLMHLLNFRWIYPSKRDHVPRWLMDGLLERLRLQLDLPPRQMKVCRGRMLSRVDYQTDVQEGASPTWAARASGAVTEQRAATPPVLKVAAIGDLHVKDGQAAPCRDLFAEVSREADVLVLAGDLTDLGKPDEARLLAEDLRSCAVAVVAVLGNHDYECGHVEEVSDIIRGAGVHLLDGQSCEIKGMGFVGVKGFAGGFGSRMLGSFGEPAIKPFVAETVNETRRLENAMRRVRSGRVVVMLHYAPVAETVVGEPPEILPFLGSSRMAETIDRFKVSAVVHGHAHRGRYEGRTPAGQPVYNVAAHIPKPTGRPYALLEV